MSVKHEIHEKCSICRRYNMLAMCSRGLLTMSVKREIHEKCSICRHSTRHKTLLDWGQCSIKSGLVPRDYWCNGFEPMDPATTESHWDGPRYFLKQPNDQPRN